MRQVFAHLHKGGWHVKRSKCEVFLQEAEFLGHRITADGVAWYQARWRQFPLGPYPLVCESYKHFLDYVTIIGAFVKTLLRWQSH